MTENLPQTPEVPVWARDDAFPQAPAGWGWLDTKGKSQVCDSLDALTAAIREDPDASVTLVWAPSHLRMVLPEELEGMGDALRIARARWARNDLANATLKLRGGSLLLAGLSIYTFYPNLKLAERLAVTSGLTPDLLAGFKFASTALLRSNSCGLGLLVFVIFAFIPWYQARKRQIELGTWTEAGIAKAAPAIRFETWLDRQKSPVTRVLLGLITLVALAQVLFKIKTDGWSSLLSLLQHWDGTAAAGLIKDRYQQGEWWRLFTAPWLHGNLLHFLMNVAALAYLGKRLEVFARWPHLPMVFLFAATLGGEASARWVSATSVGASGGLMGCLGFLLVFETLHARLVPRRARRRLAGGVLLTAVIGLIGYRLIDNAAHAGGLLAGMFYAAIVFPASASPNRPRTTHTDLFVGSAALAILSAAAFFTIYQIMETKASL